MCLGEHTPRTVGLYYKEEEQEETGSLTHEILAEIGFLCNNKGFSRQQQIIRYCRHIHK